MTYGSDSGHQAGFGRGGRPGGAPRAGGEGRPGGEGRAAGEGRPGGEGRAGAPRAGGPGPAGDDWALNDEAIANLGYMQMKKTHDAAFVVIERLYGARPQFNYYIGSSQGGREALTVAQRYPADYDGIAANVPIVGFSTLMLAPELIRIQEKPLANWVTAAKVNAIRGEFMRQCDTLDGLADGIINNYMACRAIFDVTQGKRGRHPWAAKRCPGNVDPNPADTTRQRLSDRWPDRDARVHLLPLRLRHAARTRGEDVRDVGAEHRSVGQRPHRERPASRDRKAPARPPPIIRTSAYSASPASS